jgi:hypothetical protein
MKATKMTRAPNEILRCPDLVAVSLLSAPLRWFAKAYAGASAVLLDKFDAAHFKRTSDDVECGMAWLASSRLQLMDSYEAYAGCSGKILLAPVKEATGGSALR